MTTVYLEVRHLSLIIMLSGRGFDLTLCCSLHDRFCITFWHYIPGYLSVNVCNTTRVSARSAGLYMCMCSVLMRLVLARCKSRCWRRAPRLPSRLHSLEIHTTAMKLHICTPSNTNRYMYVCTHTHTPTLCYYMYLHKTFWWSIVQADSLQNSSVFFSSEKLNQLNQVEGIFDCNVQR